MDTFVTHAETTAAQDRLRTLWSRIPARDDQSLVVCEAGGGPAPPEVTRLGVPRMHLILDGEERLTCVQDGVVTHLRVSAGTWVYCKPHAWTRIDWRTRRHSLGVVFHDGFTRFLCTDHDGRSNRRALRRGPDVVHHSPRPLPAGGRHLLRALESLAEPDAVNTAATQTLAALLTCCKTELALVDEGPADASRRLWQDIVDFLRGHAHRGIGRDEVARRFRIHPASLSRLFARHDDLGFQERLTSYRLDLARRLLHDRRRLSVAAIARASGFGSATYFARVFRRATGQSPAAFRAERTD